MIGRSETVRALIVSALLHLTILIAFRLTNGIGGLFPMHTNSVQFIRVFVYIIVVTGLHCTLLLPIFTMRSRYTFSGRGLGKNA